MTSVATGGPRIQDVNSRYQELYRDVDSEFRDRGGPNPIPYSDLWDWYGRWSQPDLKSYQSRRNFLRDLFGGAARQVNQGAGGGYEATGWERIDRTITEAKARLASATSEEHFQTVGLLCREALITLGQEVWAPTRHPSVDGVKPSDTDARRRIESYLAVELSGGANEEARKHARAALALAIALQHRRTATFRDAAMCLEGTASVISLVAIVEGRRDPAEGG